MDLNKIEKENFIKRFFYCLGTNIINAIKVFGLPIAVTILIACFIHFAETYDYKPLVACLLTILIGKSLVDATCN